MIRKFEISDAEGKKIEFEYTPETKMVSYSNYGIELSMENQRFLQSFINITNALMDGNTIDKIEVEEITGE